MHLIMFSGYARMSTCKSPGREPRLKGSLMEITGYGVAEWRGSDSNRHGPGYEPRLRPSLPALKTGRHPQPPGREKSFSPWPFPPTATRVSPGAIMSISLGRLAKHRRAVEQLWAHDWRNKTNEADTPPTFAPPLWVRTPAALRPLLRAASKHAWRSRDRKAGLPHTFLK